MNSIIIMMLNKHHQTVKHSKKVLFGSTVKIVKNGSSTHRSTSALSKKSSSRTKVVDPLGKTFKKGRMPAKSLKSKFDELVN